MVGRRGVATAWKRAFSNMNSINHDADETAPTPEETPHRITDHAWCYGVGSWITTAVLKDGR